jgi:uncharacterized repeat protein (TIGR01451 family)
MTFWRWAPTCRANLARLGVLVLLAGLCVALPALLTPQRVARAAPTVCSTPVTIANGDFETPVIPANTMVLQPEPDMGGWKTTATDRIFEHWREVRQGFTSGQGNQFIELNANQVSAVYQDLVTTPGQTLRWELKHRGRLGTDVMAVKIGPSGGLVQQALLSDGPAAWGTHAMNYTVPAGQTSTRFWFESISAAQNKPTYGNFLDAISFGTEACLVTTTSVSGGSGAGGAANVGDVLTYTITTENKGGNPAKNVIITDDLPSGASFVPGSIRTITGASSGTVTDATDTDTGEYDAGTRTVRVRAGLGADATTGGTLPVGAVRSISYQVRVTASAASASLANESTVSFLNDVTGATQTSTSTSAATTVAPAADLGVTAVVQAPGVMAGRTATTVLTVANNGPDDAATVQVSAVVPYGITGVGAVTPLGTCSASTTPPAGPSTVTCAIPALPRATSTTVTITGTVLPQATPGAQATLTASVSSATFEVNQADNGTSVSAAVTTLTDLKVVHTYTPANPVPGDTITYTATVTNQGPSQARGIMLTDPIASTSTFVSATVNSTPAVPCTIAAATQTVECAVPEMMPGTSTTVTIVVSLPANGNGTVNNAVSVSSSTPEADVRDNNHSVWKTGTPEADIGVELVLDRNRAKPGDVVPFTLTVTNHGPWPAMNVSFNTIVPVGFTVNRAASPYCTPTACTLPGMVKGQVIKITGTTTVGQNAASGVQSASTTVISPTADPNSSNDTSTVTFTIDLESDLAVTQTVTNPVAGETGLVAGHAVRNVVTVTNTGTTRSEGLVLRQAIPALQPIPVATTTGATCNFQGTGTAGNVTPDGGVYVCTRTSLDDAATWQVTFDGVSLSPAYAGNAFIRTTTIAATTPDPDGADNSVTTNRPVEHRSDLGLVKVSLTPATVVQTNDVRFEITVSNKGPSVATNVLIREDPQTGLVIVSGTPATPAEGSFTIGSLTWTVPVLTVGGTAKLTVAGTAQGAGSLTDVSRIVASDSTDPVVADNTASATVTATAAAPSLGLEVLVTSTPASSGGYADGESIDYSYKVTNTGNLDAAGLTVTGTQGGAAAAPCNGGTLAVGQNVTCPAGSRPVSSADITAGQPILNEVKAVAQTAANPAPVEFAKVTSSSPLVLLRASLVVAITPTVSTPARQHAAAVGDEITYEYVVTNNGNVSMDDVTLTDSEVVALTCAPRTLAQNARMTCATTAGSGRTVDQDDLDAGGPVRNNATVTGRPGGGAIQNFGTYRADVTVAAPAPAIQVTVVSPAATPVRVADTIVYEYKVKNVGNVTVDTLAVNDSRVSGVTCPARIAVNQTLSCTSPPAQPYVVTQADVDAGAPVRNDAIVSAQGVTPGSPAATAEGGASIAVVLSTPALTLAHSVIVPAGGVVLGDVLSFSYQVRNTGNVTMTALTVTDTLNGPANCPKVKLDVGEDMICAAPVYTVGQGDVDAIGPITGTATLRGRSPAQAAPADQDTEPLSVTVRAGTTELQVIASAAVQPAEHATAVEPGDRIAFTFGVTNLGTVTMQEITVNDTLSGPARCPSATLAPGASMTCAPPAEHTVTAADVRAGGSVVSVATAAARGPGRPMQTFGPSRAAVPVLVPKPALHVNPTAAISSGDPVRAVPGDTISYRYEVVNVGNQPMSAIAVDAVLAGAINCPAQKLVTREAMTCTAAPYPVTEEHVEAGRDIIDEITVTGTAPLDPDLLRFGPFRIAVDVLDPVPTLRLTMDARITVNARSNGVSTGNGVRYHYTVTNTGNVTVRDVAVADARAGAVTCEATRLSPGAGTACAADATYRVTQDDIDAGKPLATSAVARGDTVAGSAVASNTAEVTVPIAPPAPRVAAEQTAEWTDTDGNGKLGTRDDVVSTLFVTNTGNVTLINIRVTGLPAKVTCDPDRAAPGETVRCVSAVYHLTAEEIRRGTQTYEARVTGDLLDPDAPPARATAPSTVVVPADRPGPAPTRQPTPGASPSASESPMPGGGDVPLTGGSSLVAALSGSALILIGLGLLVLTYQLRPRRHAVRILGGAVCRRSRHRKETEQRTGLHQGRHAM